MRRKQRRNIAALILISLLVTGAVAGWNFYHRIYEPNIRLHGRVTDYLYIPTGARFETVIDSLKANGSLKNSKSFTWLAGKMNYINNVKPGRYSIRHGMNNRELITLLRSGLQKPVNVTFNNIRTIEQFAGRISAQLEVDSLSILKIFTDEKHLNDAGLNRFNSISILIPNTYEFYWNTSAKQFYERMLKEHDKFWNEKRKQRLNKSGLTRSQTIIIASIVEQETRMDDEKPVIAGVYLNRFKKGWKLEADPTLVYALGDFNIRRVLNIHKEIESPYNTYKYTGLPPGPICIPGIASVDAVLNYSEHDYYYFCAKDDFSGYHSFAKTYSDHLLNAKRFQRALTRKGIMS